MDHQKRLDRINELAHKQKSVGLTEEEKAEAIRNDVMITDHREVLNRLG